MSNSRCKTEDHVSEQFFKQHNIFFENWNHAEVPLEVPLNNCKQASKQDLDQFSCSESVTSSCNHGEYEEDMCYSGHRDAEDLYHGAIKLDPRYERDSLLKMEEEEYKYDFIASPDNIPKFAFQEEEQRQKSGSFLQVSRNKGSNAIEKARQREVKKEVERAKGGVRGEELRFAELAHKARIEAGLAFRSPHREVGPTKCSFYGSFFLQQLVHGMFMP